MYTDEDGIDTFYFQEKNRERMDRMTGFTGFGEEDKSLSSFASWRLCAKISGS
jgi:hypothetical protein